MWPAFDGSVFGSGFDDEARSAPAGAGAQKPNSSRTRIMPSSNSNEVTVSPMNSVLPWKDIDDMNRQLVSPVLDVYNLPDSYVVVTSIAGASPQNVDVSYDSSSKQLSISGTIENMHSEEDRGKYLIVSERQVGKFERHILVGRDAKVDEDKIRAKFKNGTLKVILPKILGNKAQKKQISVTMESEEDEENKESTENAPEA